MSSEGKYNVKAVTKKLGINPETLRAWERRYQIIKPSRNEAGHRLYSDQHLAILTWLIDKVKEGFTISQAIELYEKGEVFQGIVGDSTSFLTKTVSDLFEALSTFQESKARKIIEQAFSMYQFERVVFDIFGGVVRKVQDLHGTDKLVQAQVNFICSFLTSRLSLINHSLPSSTRMPMVIIYGANRKNEVECQLFTFYLRYSGFQTTYIQSSIEEIDFVTSKINASYVFICCNNIDVLEEAIAFTKSQHVKTTTIYCCLLGQTATRLSENERNTYKEYIFGLSKQEWEKEMLKKGLYRRGEKNKHND
ncbi:MerR family transcriptional regulator [Anaerobacillus sp. MEB173]|uniref:MerR family transcriptional regulator n=1 Tax=Anaerobacillus sp. MEB173 TaxID=3383345 RepID=UPI003F8DE540